MSVSGPCLWMPSLSPPISSHISAVSAHFSPARDGQYLQPKPVSVSPTLLRSWEQGSTPSNEPRVEMQQAALKAENALPSAASAGKPGQQCAETDTPLGGVETSNPRNRTDPRLTRMRLPKLDCSEPLLSKHRGGNLHTESPLDSGGGPRDETQDRVNEDSETSPSDGGMGSSAGAEQQKTPAEIKADKKKMKRFRLTHNQTRFLMSEFTRQAHPDAAHRERLSREIPGLSPRQVQVWFQNRRAKLKRLTSNDRERVLKSRALPDDFDTTQVLRSPFDHKSGSEMAFPPGRHYVGPNSDPNALKMMTEGLQRPNDDDYVISPLSSASTTNGSHFSSITPRKNSSSVPHSANDAGVPERIPELQRNDRSFPFIRSSSFSEACAQPPFNAPLAPSHGFPRPGEQLAHPGIDYARRAMDYRLAGPRGMMVGYDQRHLDESVSPTDQETHVPSDQASRYQPPFTMPAPKGYGMEMNSQMQPGRHMPLQSIPVSNASEYRGFAYNNSPYGIHTSTPFTQANSSSLSLPASFAPSDTPQASVYTSGDERMNQPPILTPLRTKFGNPPYEYANYL